MKATAEQLIAELHKLKATWVELSTTINAVQVKEWNAGNKHTASMLQGQATALKRCASDLHDLIQTLQ